MNERKDEHFFNISEISTNIKKLKISKSPKKLKKILETHLWRNETARRFGRPNSNFDRKQHLGRNLLEDFTYFQGEAIFKNNFRWLLLRNEIIYINDCDCTFMKKASHWLISLSFQKTSSCEREQQILFLISPNDLRINSNDLRMTSMFLVNIQLEKVTDTETL